jgi:hypothetical protein
MCYISHVKYFRYHLSKRYTSEKDILRTNKKSRMQQDQTLSNNIRYQQPYTKNRKNIGRTI